MSHSIAIKVATAMDNNNINTLESFYSQLASYISRVRLVKKLHEGPTLKCEASLQCFLRNLKQKNFFNQINFIHLVLLALVSMALLKCTNFPLVIHFLNFVQLFHLQVLLIIILSVSIVIFFHPQYLMITLKKNFKNFMAPAAFFSGHFCYRKTAVKTQS